MLESRTVLQQQQEYAGLEPWWSGARERAGLVRGLSSVTEGRSSLLYSPNFEHLDRLERAQSEAQGNEEPKRGRKANRVNDAAVVELLKRGAPYRRISAALGVSVKLVRRVARDYWIDRSRLANGRRAQ